MKATEADGQGPLKVAASSSVLWFTAGYSDDPPPSCRHLTLCPGSRRDLRPRRNMSLSQKGWLEERVLRQAQAGPETAVAIWGCSTLSSTGDRLGTRAGGMGQTANPDSSFAKKRKRSRKLEALCENNGVSICTKTRKGKISQIIRHKTEPWWFQNATLWIRRNQRYRSSHRTSEEPVRVEQGRWLLRQHL